MFFKMIKHKILSDNIKTVDIKRIIYNLSESDRIKFFALAYRKKYLNDAESNSISCIFPEYDWIKHSPFDCIDLTIKHLKLYLVGEMFGMMMIKTVFYKGKKLFSANSNNVCKNISKLVSLRLDNYAKIRTKIHTSSFRTGDFIYYKRHMKYLTVYID